jgi:hypothetical protein
VHRVQTGEGPAAATTSARSPSRPRKGLRATRPWAAAEARSRCSGGRGPAGSRGPWGRTGAPGRAAPAVRAGVRGPLVEPPRRLAAVHPLAPFGERPPCARYPHARPEHGQANDMTGDEELPLGERAGAVLVAVTEIELAGHGGHVEALRAAGSPLPRSTSPGHVPVWGLRRPDRTRPPGLVGGVSRGTVPAERGI